MPRMMDSQAKQPLGGFGSDPLEEVFQESEAQIQFTSQLSNGSSKSGSNTSSRYERIEEVTVLRNALLGVGQELFDMEKVILDDARNERKYHG
jgi:hypothetical protein